MNERGGQQSSAVLHLIIGPALGGLLAWLALFGMAGCAGPPGQSGEVVWEMTSAADSVAVGDAFVVQLRAAWPDSLGPQHLSWFSSPDSLLVVRRDSTSVPAPEGWRGRLYELTLLAPRSGSCRVPPAALVSTEGETLRVTAAGTLQVSSRLAAGEEPELRPLSPFVSLRGFPWGWIFFGVALAGAGAIAWIWWRRRRMVLEEPALPPPLPPAEEFELGIRALDARRLVERGELRVYAQELSWIFRRYLGRRWEQPALEATRPEIIRWLPQTGLCVRDQGRLASWLEETDRIKFAGERPLLSRAEELLAATQEMVNRTERLFEPKEELSSQTGGAT